MTNTKLSQNKSGYSFNGFCFTRFSNNYLPDFNPDNAKLVSVGKPRKHLSQLFYHNDLYLIAPSQPWLGDICVCVGKEIPGDYQKLLDYYGVDYQYVTREDKRSGGGSANWGGYIEYLNNQTGCTMLTWDSDTQKIVKREPTEAEKYELAEEIGEKNIFIDPRIPVRVYNQLSGFLWDRTIKELQHYGIVKGGGGE